MAFNGLQIAPIVSQRQKGTVLSRGRALVMEATAAE